MTDRTRSRSVKQRPDHDTLLRRLEWRPGARSAGRPLEAIVIPAARRAHNLRGLVALAANYGTTLVVLASHDCDIDEAAALVASTPGSGRAVLVAVPPEAKHEMLSLATSASRFRTASGERSSNLSLKRNIGLLLARLRGWSKIMFLDDDVIGVTADHLARVAHHLDANQFAGLKIVNFPDNSVVCHANRLIGRPQGIFVSGAALGVNTARHRVEVFPDVYNEDWFAFAGEAESSGVAHVGNVGQLEYNPFKATQRAGHEEFGDLVAEGLYALLSDGLRLNRATESYWAGFIEARRGFIEEIQQQLEDKNETHERVQAVKSLQRALDQLDSIEPDHCTDFLDAWRADRNRFARDAEQLTGGHDYWDAFAALGLTDWQEARFGVARMPALPTISPRAPRR
jgi:hypothetical protein